LTIGRYSTETVLMPANWMRSGESCTRPVTPGGNAVGSAFLRTERGMPQIGQWGTSPLGS